MNKNTVKGALKDAEGAIQRKWGETTNDPVDVAVGTSKQVAGKAQKNLGQVQDEF